jgi:fructokinase
MHQPSFTCFGECLWDIVEGQYMAGGAPMNVYFHLKQLGIPATFWSAVGRDELGIRLKNWMISKHMDISGIRENDYPTGTVLVKLDPKGVADYEIAEPVAWDFIGSENRISQSGSSIAALVYGSLASRGDFNFKTILELTQKSPLNIMDVNLRKTSPCNERLDELIGQAHIVKVNEEELDVLTPNWINSIEQRMEYFYDKYALDIILVTLGSEGAMAFDGVSFCRQAGFAVKVADTIGSGDAFTAGFLASTHRGLSMDICLKVACRYGSWVASHHGATPILDPFISEFLSEMGWTQ